ncbi:MAG: Ger(x)C family spore germination protein [Alicyclobacillus macrosporangiidus]|uniref:Ger(x)C family spore germination protein n=1 Tax=Alicyclobacillus macrosporangiidus TaxID=392015 RepID=UPI0026F1F134|nr:Ger(x)C family spore germination protein [Alicyclobacillus macrosporangiidus]MCL6599496.1 Ger(x)C family spore germination protein [Alicyclobacillus macrosporangiidus]
MTRVRVLAVVICLAVSIGLTGCWDGIELQQRAIVLIMGIDPGDTPDQVKVTLQLAKPHRLSVPPSSGQSGGAGQTSPVIAVSEQGRDVGEALHRIQLDLDRRLFYGHLQAVVIHRKLAERGILTLLNPLVQSRIVSRNLWVFVSEPPAGAFLEKTPELDVIPAMYLANLFRNRIWLNRPYDATVGGFHQRLATPGIEPYALLITGIDPKLSAPQIDGLAVFSGDRLAGVLTGQPFTGWLMLENQFPRSRLAFPCPEDPGKQFVIDVKSVRSRLRVRNLSSARPYVDVEVRMRGSVEGGACIPAETQAELETLKRQVERQTQMMVTRAIEWTQSPLHADVLGIGREVYRYQAAEWRGDEWWRSTFERLDVQVHVDLRIDFMQTYDRAELVYGGNDGGR